MQSLCDFGGHLSIFSAFGSLIEIYPDRSRFGLWDDAGFADFRALRSDWEAVGSDLRSASGAAAVHGQ